MSTGKKVIHTATMLSFVILLAACEHKVKATLQMLPMAPPPSEKKLEPEENEAVPEGEEAAFRQYEIRKDSGTGGVTYIRVDASLHQETIAVAYKQEGDAVVLGKLIPEIESQDATNYVLTKWDAAGDASSFSNLLGTYTVSRTTFRHTAGRILISGAEPQDVVYKDDVIYVLIVEEQFVEATNLIESRSVVVALHWRSGEPLDLWGNGNSDANAWAAQRYGYSVLPVRTYYENRSGVGSQAVMSTVFGSTMTIDVRGRIWIAGGKATWTTGDELIDEEDAVGMACLDVERGLPVRSFGVGGFATYSIREPGFPRVQENTYVSRGTIRGVNVKDIVTAEGAEGIRIFVIGEMSIVWEGTNQEMMGGLVLSAWEDGSIDSTFPSAEGDLGFGPVWGSGLSTRIRGGNMAGYSWQRGIALFYFGKVDLTFHPARGAAACIDPNTQSVSFLFTSTDRSSGYAAVLECNSSTQFTQAKIVRGNDWDEVWDSFTATDLAYSRAGQLLIGCKVLRRVSGEDVVPGTETAPGTGTEETIRETSTTIIALDRYTLQLSDRFWDSGRRKFLDGRGGAFLGNRLENGYLVAFFDGENSLHREEFFPLIQSP